MLLISRIYTILETSPRAERVAALILESGLQELAVEPCSGACREAIELYFSTSPERWRTSLTPRRP